MIRGREQNECRPDTCGKEKVVTNEVVATRWNGKASKPLGNPVSHGHATWFVVDGYVAESVEKAARKAAQESPNGLLPKYREMAEDAEREGEAEEWSEGVIGDGNS